MAEGTGPLARLRGGGPRGRFAFLTTQAKTGRHAALRLRSAFLKTVNAGAKGKTVASSASYTLSGRMPYIALLAPFVIPLATAAAVALCGVVGWKIRRILLAGGSWGAFLV